MAKATFSQVAGLADAMPADHFEILFGDIPGSNARAGEILSLSCQSAAIPGVDNEPLNITYHGYDFVFSGKNTFAKTLAVTIGERMKGMPVYTALLNWQQIVRGFESGTSAGYIDDYSRTVEMLIYDGTNNNTPAKTIIFERFFPTSLPDTTVDTTSTSPMLISPVFSWTRAYPKDLILR